MKMNYWEAYEDKEKGKWIFNHIEDNVEYLMGRQIDRHITGNLEYLVKYYYNKDKVEEKDRFKREFKERLREQLKRNIEKEELRLFNLINSD